MGKRKTIAFVGQPEYFRCHYRDMLDSEEFDCTEFRVNPFVEETYSPLIGEKFDYIFFFRGEFAPEGILRNLKGKRVAISSEPMPKHSKFGLMQSDELVARMKQLLQIKDKSFDHIFHYDKHSITILRAEGIKVDGEFYLPMSKPDRYENSLPDYWDVCFFGRSNEYREAILGALKRDFRVIHITHGADEDLMCEVAKCSQIVLNLNTEGLPSLNPRLQQMLSYGAFVISEPNTNHDMFKSGEHYIECFADKIYEKVKEYLEKEDDRRKISDAGRQRVSEKVCCVESWKNLIKKIEEDNA